MNSMQAALDLMREVKMREGTGRQVILNQEQAAWQEEYANWQAGIIHTKREAKRKGGAANNPFGEELAFVLNDAVFAIKEREDLFMQLREKLDTAEACCEHILSSP